MYRGSGNKHIATIGDREIQVDSNLEERVLRWLEENDFEDRWEKPTIGLNVGKSNYTPDIELSIQFNDMTHRAIVEIKPEKSFFTKYISARMRKVADFYFADMLLLYADKEKCWYRIDKKTGELTNFTDLLKPGEILIKDLYKPLKKNAPSVYNHHYKTQIQPIRTTIRAATELTTVAITGKEPEKQSKPRKRSKSKTTAKSPELSLKWLPNLLDAVLIEPFRFKRRRK